jgi:hypothetical protein
MLLAPCRYFEPLLQYPCSGWLNFFVICIFCADHDKSVLLIKALGAVVGYLDVQVYSLDLRLGVRKASVEDLLKHVRPDAKVTIGLRVHR